MPDRAPGGWHGRLARVDLSAGTWTEETLRADDTRRFLGGRGMGVLEVARRVPAGTDPLSPGNILVVAPGPLAGSPVPSSGRFSLAARSPLTGTMFDSSCGGPFGLGLKRAGYDALVITGRAAVPSVVLVRPGGVEVRPAGDLWGAEADLACRRLREKGGEKAESLAIGPAGEKLVPLAGVRSAGRVLGRGGLGAVLGSKNLKGVAAGGDLTTRVADPERLKFVVHEMDKWLKASPVTSQGLPRFGTAVLVKVIDRMGMFPSRNFTRPVPEDPDAVSGERLADLTVRRTACRGCTIGCGRVTRVLGREGEGPEYESIWALGPQCGIFDLGFVARANDLCNRLGLDTISTGVTIGCAMELAERGLLDGGPRFGRTEGLLELIEGMAHRDGLGAELAEGSRRLAAGRGAPELAMQVKGLELPAYDPRGAQGQALGFATSNRGACHLRSYMIGPEVLGIPRLVDRKRTGGKAGLTIVLQNSNAAMDSLALCRFLSFALGDDYYARALAAVTGEDWRAQDLQEAGERIWTLERLFNLREGFTAADDTLPPRFLREPIAAGPSAGRTVDLEPMLREYYRFRGWTPEGIPPAERISSLGLEWFDGT